jgi:hypothetical protein
MFILTECNDVFSNMINYLDINHIKLLRLIFKNDILLIELINKCEIKYTNIIKFDCDIFNYNIKIIFNENKPYLRKLNKFNKLTHLTFCNIFNELIQELPNSLTHLTFSYDFNQPIQKLPNSLKHLTFNEFGNYNIKLINRLPITLEHFTINNKNML